MSAQPPTPTPPPQPQNTKLVAGIGITAIASMLLSVAVSLGWIKPSDADQFKKMADVFGPIIQQVIDKKMDSNKNPVDPPAPVVPPVPVNPPQPTPPTPFVPVVVPPSPTPQPAPQPAPPTPNPVPVPIPVPPTLLPEATIVVMDPQGNPITGGVDCGRPFVVHSKGSTHADTPGSLNWIIDKSAPDDVDAIPYPDGSGYVCVLRNGGSATFVLSVASAGHVNSALVRVTCNKGPQPPPDVNPTPTPNPVPVTQTYVKLFLIYDPMHDSPQQAIVRDSFSVWNSFKTRGHDYGFYTVNMNDPNGKAMMAYAVKKGLSLPCVVAASITGNTPIDAIPSPATVIDVDKWLTKISGK